MIVMKYESDNVKKTLKWIEIKLIIYLVSSEESLHSPRTRVNGVPQEVNRGVRHRFLWISAEVLRDFQWY